MFYLNTKSNQNNFGEVKSLLKTIEIDRDLNCFILIEFFDEHFSGLLLNKIVDNLIDNIDKKDVYNTFGIVLENINFFVKNFKDSQKNQEKISIFIGILENNNFYFSKTGNMFGGIINSKNELLEITDRNYKIDFFDYISSGKVNKNDKIVLTNLNLFDYLTKTDVDDLIFLDDVEKINNHILDVLAEENITNSVSLISFKFIGEEIGDVLQYGHKIKGFMYKIIDNQLSKKSIALWMYLKEQLDKKGKIVKNLVFFTGIILSSFLLYSIIGSVVGTNIETSQKSQLKTDLITAREYVRLANENISNPEAFDLNIKKAEELVEKVKQEKVFLNDIDSLQNDISIIKKQFNGIEIFEGTSDNLVFKGNFENPIKLLENNKKLYILGKNNVYGPIISGKESKKYSFEDLQVDDEFIDGGFVGDDLIIMTKKSRVVKFSKDSTFKYINVIGQDSWQQSKILESYNGNIYLTNKESNQIYKHIPASGSYTSGEGYLNPQDSKNIGEILSIGIDGGIYILKKNLELIKFFSSPKYRIESIVLNKLPKNYNLEEGKVNLIVKSNLNYIYIYLNKKVWIFQPNTRNYSDTKSLTYIGQIEGKNQEIKSVVIPRDGEINVLTEGGIYKIEFEVKDDGKLIIR